MRFRRVGIVMASLALVLVAAGGTAQNQLPLVPAEPINKSLRMLQDDGDCITGENWVEVIEKAEKFFDNSRINVTLSQADSKKWLKDDIYVMFLNGRRSGEKTILGSAFRERKLITFYVHPWKIEAKKTGGVCNETLRTALASTLAHEIVHIIFSVKECAHLDQKNADVLFAESTLWEVKHSEDSKLGEHVYACFEDYVSEDAPVEH